MKVKQGSIVDIYYQGRIENSIVLFSNREKEPYEFKVGEGKFLSGIEEGIIGMQKGETRQLVLPPEKGFGYRRDDYIRKYKKQDISQKVINRGDIYQFQVNSSDKKLSGTVIHVDRDTVTLDFNHLAAGKTLVFDVEIADIKAR